jgi:hypothetical protein
MKHTELKWALIYVISSFLIFSCSDRTNDLKKPGLSTVAMNYISMRLGTQDAMKSQQAGPINQSFRNLFGNFQHMRSGRLSGDTTVTSDPVDSTLYPDPWVSCAVITETVNGDGSITTVTDYGQGCDEGYTDWKYRQWGKFISTCLYNNVINGTTLVNNYFYKTDYEKFGGYYYSDSSEWEMNGHSNYTGESKYDTADYSFSGSYSYNDDITYRWNKDNYSYKGNGMFTYTNSKWITENSDYEYATDTSYYKTTVLKPLVMDYTCSPPILYLNGAKGESTDSSNVVFVFTYVSGIEDIHYRQGGEDGHFSIDYGDGTCDNIISVTENGNTVVINLSDNWMGAAVNIK